MNFGGMRRREDSESLDGTSEGADDFPESGDYPQMGELPPAGEMPDMESGSHGMDHDMETPGRHPDSRQETTGSSDGEAENSSESDHGNSPLLAPEDRSEGFRITIRRPGMKIPPQKQMEANHPCGRIRMVKAGWE